jgi:replicative DNA helicase
MVELMERSRTVDLITIQEELIRSSSLESAGGIAYLAGLLEGMPHLVNTENYIGIIREKSLLRQMISSTSRIMAECFDQAEPAEQILDKAEQSFFNLSEKRIKTGFVSVKEMHGPATALIEKLYTEREMITGVATGFTDLDRMTAGLQPGDLIILAARPSMGKTALALNMAHHIAVRKGQGVGIFSLEMSKEQLLMRFPVCRVHGRRSQSSHRLSRQGRLQPAIEGLATVSRAPLFIDDSSTLTVMEMRAKARRLKAEHGLSLLIVDYLAADVRLRPCGKPRARNIRHFPGTEGPGEGAECSRDRAVSAQPRARTETGRSPAATFGFTRVGID